METVIKKQITLLDNRVTTVNYVQGTDVIPIEFEIMDYKLPTDTEARLYVHKPSTAIIYNFEKISGQKITITPTTQMFAEVGKNYGNIEIVGKTDMKKIATFPILFMVAPNFRDEGALESKDEYEALMYYMKLSMSYAVGGSGIRSGEDTDNSKYYKERANDSAVAAKKSEQNAKTSEINAKTSETNAKTSETNAKTSETNAKTSETNAKASEQAAAASQIAAKASEQAAAASQIAAKASEQAAASSQSAAKASETNARASETSASASATKAESYADGGTGSRTGEDTDNARYYKDMSKSYARGDSGARSGETTDSALYYKDQSKSYADKSADSAKDAQAASKTVTDYLKKIEDSGSFVGPRGPQGENGKDAVVTNMDILYGFQIVGDQLCGYYSDKTSPPPFYIDGNGDLVFEIEDDDPIDYGRVRGSYWWSGDKVSGTSTTPSVFATGITQVYKDDYYVNTSAYDPVVGGSRGNVYRCANGGDAATATWYYVGSILGPVADTTPYRTELTTHKNDKSNPHGVTKAQVGLGNVDNTPDSEKKVASAGKLTTARTIAISGAATGTATSFDGSKNVSIPVTSLDATKLSGVISLDNLPSGALERQVTVKDDAARLALTTGDIQLGDTVKVQSTGLMYLVVDELNLDSEDGYSVYTAGSASSVPWSGVTGRPDWVKGSTKPSYAWNEVTGKPSTFPPSSHKHSKADVTDFPASLPASDVYGWAKKASLSEAINTGLTTGLSNPTDADYYVTQYAGGGTQTTTYHRRPHSALWNYIEGKISSVLGLTKENYGGKAASAGSVAWGNVSGRPGSFKGATSSAAGSTGLVPAPAKGQQDYYLKADGTWATVTGAVKGVKVDAAGVADSANSVAWANVTGKPSTFPPSSHTHDDRYYTESEIDNKLKNYVGTSDSRLTNSRPANGGTSTNVSGGNVVIGKNGGTWISGMTQSNSRIQWTSIGVRDGSRYDPIMWGKDTSGNVWNLGWSAFGGIGFFGFKSGRTANGTDGSMLFDPATGVTSGSFKGALDGNAGSATKLTTSAGDANSPVYFSNGKPVICNEVTDSEVQTAIKSLF